LKFVVMFELGAEAQLTRCSMASAWNSIRTGLHPVNLVVNTISRTQDETGRQLVGCNLPLGYVTQQFRLEGSGQERKMVQRRDETRRQVGKAPKNWEVKTLDLLGCEWALMFVLFGFH
jgi:hypothetical protein